MASDREKCLAAGMDEYLSKPINQDALQGVLRRYGAVFQVPKPRLAPEQPVAPAVATVLDPAQLAQLRSLPGRQGPTLLADVVGMALADVPASLERLLALMEQRAAVETGQLAHRLAGSAANLGAASFRKALQEIEAAARGPDWAATARLRADLDRHWQLVRDALKQLHPPSAP
jgi:HPt (histidine-containing phosphotransfer) domain-containing protein